MLDRERGYHTFILEVDKPKIISAQLKLFREKENLNWLFFNQINTKICITSINRLNINRSNENFNLLVPIKFLHFFYIYIYGLIFRRLYVWKLNQN